MGHGDSSLESQVELTDKKNVKIFKITGKVEKQIIFKRKETCG